MLREIRYRHDFINSLRVIEVAKRNMLEFKVHLFEQDEHGIIIILTKSCEV